MATVQSRFDPNRAHVDELDRRVRKRRNPPATLAQLRNALIDEWNNIPMRTVNALDNSIQRRIRAATAARGGHTRYWFSVWFWFQDLGGCYQWTIANSRLVDHKPMKFGTFVPYMYRFVIIVKYLTYFFKLEWNLWIKFTLRFFFLSVYNNPTYCDRQVLGNSVGPDQMPLNLASDQGLHCLLHIQQYFGHIR